MDGNVDKENHKNSIDYEGQKDAATMFHKRVLNQVAKRVVVWIRRVSEERKNSWAKNFAKKADKKADLEHVEDTDEPVDEG